MNDDLFRWTLYYITQSALTASYCYFSNGCFFLYTTQVAASITFKLAKVIIMLIRYGVLVQGFMGSSVSIFKIHITGGNYRMYISCIYNCTNKFVNLYLKALYRVIPPVINSSMLYYDSNNFTFTFLTNITDSFTIFFSFTYRV